MLQNNKNRLYSSVSRNIPIALLIAQHAQFEIVDMFDCKTCKLVDFIVIARLFLHANKMTHLQRKKTFETMFTDERFSGSLTMIAFSLASFFTRFFSSSSSSFEFTGAS